MAPTLFDAVQLQAERVRSFLEPVWGWVRTDDDGQPLSTGFCISSAVLLRHVLNATVPGPWRLAGGHPFYGQGGFLDPAGEWADHHWVVHESSGVIVDVTADQFGDAAVVVTNKGDSRYCENLPDAVERDRNALMCCEWPKNWVPLWDASGGRPLSRDAIERWMVSGISPTEGAVEPVGPVAGH